MKKVRHCRKCDKKLTPTRYYYCTKCVRPGQWKDDEGDLVYHIVSEDEDNDEDQ